MRILAIETSCDETAISIIEAKGAKGKAQFKILANNVASQIDIHKEYGGVVPMLAKREHIKNLPVILEKSLKDSKLKISDMDLIAVTVGPGLEPALWTGIVFAEELSQKYKIPLIPVNHMEGHIFSILVPEKKKTFKALDIKFPALALLVSGGHTELVLIKDWLKYEKIGGTRDDAAGEAFDKVARLLGLPYPGGPEISRLAGESRKLSLRELASATARARGIFQQKNIRIPQGQVSEIKLPRPMLKTLDFDFSFSGLKTAVLYMVQKLGELTPELKKEIAREFEDAVVEVLAYKTLKAAKKYKIKTLIVAGGVAANSRLKEIFEAMAKKEKLKLFFPARELATDNSLMIALAAYFEKDKKRASSKKLKAQGNLEL
jgi:N6-L-threonylcarbamoyladenine synthase